LAEIRELVGADGSGEAADVLKAAKHRRDVVVEDMERLAQVVQRLDQLITVCSVGNWRRCEGLEIPDRPDMQE
jgi:hypothetical protein